MKAESMDYQAFLKSKAPIAKEGGFDPPSDHHKSLKPHQIDVVRWAAKQGQSAIFASFGLGKSRMQLQLLKWAHELTGKKVLLVAPLGVRQEFTRSDGPAMGMKVVYCRTDSEVAACESPYIITNYERIRDGNIDPQQFGACSLDEASCLRSYGTKTTQQFCEIFQGVEYRWLATATPCPNDYIELINYAHYLGVMDRGQAMTRWFMRDSKEAGNLQIYPHEETRFWLWVATWGMFLSAPSDLGHADEGYKLPSMSVHWHIANCDYARAHKEQDDRGQRRLIPKTSGGIQEVAKERRETIAERIDAAKRLIEASPDDHWIVWHYLESERAEIKRQIPEVVSVYGSQDLEQREKAILDFSAGKFRILSVKPQIAGSGCNFQRHCHKAIFVGPTDKFNDFIQACHRIYRFLQTEDVEIHIVYADTQHETVSIMKRKWRQHDELVARMKKIVQTNGLNKGNIAERLKRNSGVERQEHAGQSFVAINNDCVEELQSFDDDSVDQIVTSIPFSDHYEYSPNYNDFGHNKGDDGFFAQFDFLVPELYRVLKPGRMACIHTKDRIEYGVMSGNGMYSVNEFSDKTVTAFKKHGWIYAGRIAIDTDVVRENAQTYRLGHSRNSEDATVMGVGSCEYVLLFRKWHPSMSPGDNARGPHPVLKPKDEYTRGKWQIHASGIWRSSGDELLSPAMLESMSVSQIYRAWRKHCKNNGYSYQTHLEFTEAVERMGKLPATHMLFAPHGHDPNIWTDVLRINTLNTDLKRKTTESHVCPLQLDVIERLIDRYTMAGETVLDPFGGLMSVPYQAIKMKRRGIGIELNPTYYGFGVGFCTSIERDLSAPTLFDLMEAGEEDSSQVAVSEL